MTLPVTKLCEIEDFTDPDIAPVVRRLAGRAGAGAGGMVDQRRWLVAMAARGLRAGASMGAEARVLALGGNMEPVLELLADMVGEVASADWGDVDWSEYGDATFDAVVTGPIEGLLDIDGVPAAAAEIGRVLKPGGVLSLSTRFLLHGQPGGAGWPGTALLTAEQLRRLVIEPSGLSVVGELQEEVSHCTMASPRDLRHLAAGGAAAARTGTGGGPLTVVGGYVFTMAHLLLRKTKESVMERTVRATAPSRGAPPGTASPPVAGGTWAERVVGLQQALVAADDLSRRCAHEIDLLSEPEYEIGRTLTLLEEGRDAARSRLGDSVDLFDTLLERSRVTPAGPPVTAHAADATLCTVRLSEGLEYQVVVDKGSADPITTTFLNGYCLFQDLVSVMLRLVSAGDAVLDIGAHVGTFTLAAAAAGCPVLAIEASPVNAALLRASVNANAFHDVRVVEAAASDEPGSVQFCAIGPWGTVLNRPPSALSIEVPAVTIDELIFELGFPRPAFVKMDVEGSEIMAMNGMRALLFSDDAPALLLESNGHTLNLMGTTPSELLAEVERFGYTAYLVDRTRLVPVSATDLQPRTEVDYLALKSWPEPLAGYEVGARLSAEERVAMLVEDCSSESEDVRAYIGRAIGDAGPELLAHPDLRAALDTLADDPVGTVRGAVEWWTSKEPA